MTELDIMWNQFDVFRKTQQGPSEKLAAKDPTFFCKCGGVKEFGEDSFLEALRKVASECALKAGQDTARQLPSNDLAAFKAGGEPGYFGKHVLTLEMVEDTPQAFEVRVTECLWAKMFREMGAAEIGYSLICHRDYADCQGFNPKITMIRSKTLMQGDDCCNHRFVWEG